MSATLKLPCCGKCGAPLKGPGIEGVCPACLLETGLEEDGLDSSDCSASAARLLSFGDYEFLGEIARGGMGVVYRARQISLNRTVAVKMILAGRLARAEEVARFRTEAETAARLQHPNIVAIHEIGEHEDCQYFSMDYVEGRTLADLVRDQPLPARQAARYGMLIAQAIHHAHAQGILHRDLKPSNVIVDENDRPRVTDFGLAKWLEGKSDLTLTGQVLGSPSFMPPEQAGGKDRTPGPCSDIYSMGAILYHLVTGRPPFSAETPTATLRMVAEVDPVPPRRLNASVPRDLETIILKSLEKDPKHRYPTARALAEELSRFLDGEPIRARPIGRLEAGHRWARRNPGVAALATAVGLLLITVALVSSVAATKLQRANRIGQDHLRDAYLAQARASRFSHQQGSRFDSLAVLGKAATIRPGMDLRDEAIAAMVHPDFRPVKTWPIPVDCQQVFDSGYQQYAFADTNGGVIVRRTLDDAEIANWRGTGAEVNGIRFSPDGRFLGVHHRGNPEQYSFHVYDLQHQGEVLLQVPDRWVRTFVFSEDGRWLVLAWAKWAGKAHHCTLSFYDLKTGGEQSSFPVVRLPYGVELNASATQLAISSEETNLVSIYSFPGGTLQQTLLHSNGVSGISWSRDGNKLAAGCANNYYYVWDLSGDVPSATLLPQEDIARACWFSPGGDTLITSGWDHNGRLWGLPTGKELLRFTADGVGAFSPDGRWIQVRPTPYSTSLCEFSGTDDCRAYVVRPAAAGTWSAVLSVDGRWMASGHRDGVRLWDLTAAGENYFIPIGSTTGLRFMRDGTALITAGDSGVRRWPISNRVQGSHLGIQIGPPERLDPQPTAASNPSNRAVMVSKGKAWIFDADSFRLERSITSTQGVDYAEMRPDGRCCATQPRDSRRIDIWDSSTGRSVTNLPTSTTPCLGFSPDGRWLITGSADDYVFWDTQTWTKARTLPRGVTGGSHGRIAFSSDGQTMALSAGKSQVRLYDSQTFELLATFDSGDGHAVASIAFSRDDAKLVVAVGETIRCWDLRSIHRQLAKLNLDFAGSPMPPTRALGYSISFSAVTAP